MLQATVKETVPFEGMGIHSGEPSKILLHPEKENTGVRFLLRGEYIPANYRFVVSTDHSTVLGVGDKRVGTVEHLLAVLYMLGIDNATVEFVKGWEVPILDGSGYYFYKALKDKVLTLREPAKVLEIKEEHEVRNCKAYIRAESSEGFQVVYTGFVKGIVEKASVFYDGKARDVVFARTFCYDYEVEHLLKRGLAKGGSLKNALVIGDGFVYNPEGMRSKDEPLRHKLLDLIGDLSLLGCRIRGKIHSYMGGHTLNHLFVKDLAERYFSTSSKSLCVSTPW
mgnify:CR=1 FL=1